MLQKDNLVGSMKGKFRRERSWREAGSRLRVEKITEVRDDGGLGQSGTGGEPAGRALKDGWPLVTTLLKPHRLHFTFM